MWVLMFISRGVYSVIGRYETKTQCEQMGKNIHAQTDLTADGADKYHCIEEPSRPGGGGG